MATVNLTRAYAWLVPHSSHEGVLVASVIQNHSGEVQGYLIPLSRRALNNGTVNSGDMFKSLQ